MTQSHPVDGHAPARKPVAHPPEFDGDHASSRGLYERARAVIPGGSSRGSIFYEPHPLYASRSDGCRIWFEDGLEVIDFLNNFTTLVLGHRSPQVMLALKAQLELGNVFGAPTRMEVELAEALCERYAAIDQVIYTSTGSEAVMAALRLARATTGSPGIAKFEGGYHGGYDYVKVSGMAAPTPSDRTAEPTSVPDTGGIPPSVLSDVHVMRFNSLESVQSVLDRHRGRIAALIVEPVLGVGGLIPPVPGFLQGIKDLCRREGIVLVFDEVITQRLHYRGAQGIYGVVPDLIVFSKIMSAGLPIGVLGGNAELMSGFDGTAQGGPLVYHSGTFNGNPLSVAGALATLRAFDEDVVSHINSLGATLASGLQLLLEELDVPVSLTSVGSLVNVHFRRTAPAAYSDVAGSDRSALREFHLRMLEAGVLIATRGLASISQPMRRQEVDAYQEAAGLTLSRMRDAGWFE